MNAFFLDTESERFPPPATRILNLHAKALPDARRIHIDIELTPFQASPQLELELSDPEGQPCGSASIIEPAAWVLDFTMHIRPAPQSTSTQPVTGKAYSLSVSLSYPDLGTVDQRQVSFEVPPPVDA
jgi:hypothetical protein